MKLLQAGPLRVRAVGPEDAPTLLLCHGYGAPGDDLVGLALPGVRCLFPEAPLDVPQSFGGRAWWALDMVRIQLALASGRGRAWDLDETPDGMIEAREKLHDAIRALGLDLSRTVIGGFSQGAMITTDLVLSERLSVAGLAILSGSYLARPRWLEAMRAMGSGLHVFQSHGTADPLLPFGVAQGLSDAFVEAGCDATFVRSPGGHEIRPAVLQALQTFVRARLELQS